MENIKSDIRKKLLETKNKKTQLLSEQLNLEQKMIQIFGSEENIINFQKLPQRTKSKITTAFFTEMHIIANRPINEQYGNLADILGKIFKGIFPSVFESLAEELIYTLLGKMGLKGGYFHKFLASFLASRPTELLAAMKNCQAFSVLLAKAISEAIVMKAQEKFNIDGLFYSVIRNKISEVLMDQPFIDGLAKSLSKEVCKIFDSFSENALEILQTKT